MKKTNHSEKLGFSLILLGFICMLVEGLFEAKLLSKVAAQYQIFYWLGLIIWALGYMKRKGDKK